MCPSSSPFSAFPRHSVSTTPQDARQKNSKTSNDVSERISVSSSSSSSTSEAGIASTSNYPTSQSPFDCRPLAVEAQNVEIISSPARNSSRTYSTTGIQISQKTFNTNIISDITGNCSPMTFGCVSCQPTSPHYNTDLRQSLSVSTSPSNLLFCHNMFTLSPSTQLQINNQNENQDSKTVELQKQMFLDFEHPLAVDSSGVRPFLNGSRSLGCGYLVCGTDENAKTNSYNSHASCSHSDNRSITHLPPFPSSSTEGLSGIVNNSASQIHDKNSTGSESVQNNNPDTNDVNNQVKNLCPLSSVSSHTDLISSLPLDLLCQSILDFLDVRDVCKLSMANKYLYRNLNGHENYQATFTLVDDSQFSDEASEQSGKLINKNWSIWDKNDRNSTSQLSPTQFINRQVETFFDPASLVSSSTSKKSAKSRSSSKNKVHGKKEVQKTKSINQRIKAKSHHLSLGKWWNDLTPAMDTQLSAILSHCDLYTITVESEFYDCSCSACSHVRKHFLYNENHRNRPPTETPNVRAESPQRNFSNEAASPVTSVNDVTATDGSSRNELLSSRRGRYICGHPAPPSSGYSETSLLESQSLSPFSLTSPVQFQSLPRDANTSNRLVLTPNSQGSPFHISDNYTDYSMTGRRLLNPPLSQNLLMRQESYSSTQIQFFSDTFTRSLIDVEGTHRNINDTPNSATQERRPLDHTQEVSPQPQQPLQQQPEQLSLQQQPQQQPLQQQPEQQLLQQQPQQQLLQQQPQQQPLQQQQLQEHQILVPSGDCCNVVTSQEKEYRNIDEDLIVAKRHAAARFFWVLRLMLLCRSSLRLIDFGSPDARYQTICDDSSSLTEFPISFRSLNPRIEFPYLTRIRFGYTIDCRFIVPIVDFCQYPQLKELEILGLTLHYDTDTPQFGIKPTMIFGPQQIFIRNDEQQLWLPALYNGGADDSLQLQGRGVYVSREYHYEGNFRNGRNEGFGKMTSKCGETYEGQWKNGRRHGLGVVIQSDGKRLDGVWVKDVLHGRGSMELADGLKYEGDWVNGALEGWAVLSKHGRLLAVGEFSDGRPHGWMSCRNEYLWDQNELQQDKNCEKQAEEENEILNRIEAVNSNNEYDAVEVCEEPTGEIMDAIESDLELNEIEYGEEFNIIEDLVFELDTIDNTRRKINVTMGSQQISPILKKISGMEGWKSEWTFQNESDDSIMSKIASYKESFDLLKHPPTIDDVFLLNSKLLQQRPGLRQHAERPAVEVAHQHQLKNKNTIPPKCPSWVEEILSKLNCSD